MKRNLKLLCLAILCVALLPVSGVFAATVDVGVVGVPREQPATAQPMTKTTSIRTAPALNILIFAPGRQTPDEPHSGR